jgi:hypothetical protein
MLLEQNIPRGERVDHSAKYTSDRPCRVRARGWMGTRNHHFTDRGGSSRADLFMRPIGDDCREAALVFKKASNLDKKNPPLGRAKPIFSLWRGSRVRSQAKPWPRARDTHPGARLSQGSISSEAQRAGRGERPGGGAVRRSSAAGRRYRIPQRRV